MRMHPNRRRAAALAAISVASMTVALLPGGEAEASSSQQVTISGNGSSVKVSGVKNLKAGWVKVKVSSTDDMWFTAARPGMSAKAATASEGIRPHKSVLAHPSAVARPADTSGSTGSAGTTSTGVASSASQAAQEITTAEGEMVAFGGGSAVSKGKAATFTLKLPVGKVAILDLDTNTVVSTLVIGKGSGASQPHADARVTEANDHVLHAPSALPRSGTVEFSNTGSKAWHELGFLQLVKGATKSDVVNYFAGKSTKVPFTVSSTFGVGTEPLSPQHSEYVQYSVPKGSYALLDLWVDDKTGQPYVAENSVKVFTVK